MIPLFLRKYILDEGDGLVPNSRPWTLAADLSTGVRRREEADYFDRKILRKWISGSREIEFRGSSNSPSDPSLKILRGSTDQIIEAMGTPPLIQPGDKSGSQLYGMQLIEYRSGKRRITIDYAGPYSRESSSIMF